MLNKKTVAIAFSAPLTRKDPLKRVKNKRPTYIELLKKCQQKGWNAVIVTRKTYQGGGIFGGFWKLKSDDSFEQVKDEIHVDLVYDRTGGLHFPVEGDSLVAIDSRDFKLLAYDKWRQYKEIGEYMPKTVRVDSDRAKDRLNELKTDLVVLKPVNGLKGLGIFIGPKLDALNFNFPDDTSYIASGFIETKNGIPGITNRRHDLRVVIINGNPVWSHVRIPPEGEYKANMSGREGGQLREILIENVPHSVLAIVKDVSQKFLDKYDNPIFSLDFGFDEKGKPWIFEINDQIGFPTPRMKAKDRFLEELIQNFEGKIHTSS